MSRAKKAFVRSHCRRKRKYRSAEEAVEMSWAAFIAGLGVMCSYRCQFCGGYHLGHRRQKGHC